MRSESLLTIGPQPLLTATVIKKKRTNGRAGSLQAHRPLIWRCAAGAALVLLLHVLLSLEHVPHFGASITWQVSWQEGSAHGSLCERITLASALERDAVEDTCYASPRAVEEGIHVTLASIIAGAGAAKSHRQLVRRNRLAFALPHGYRYCEVLHLLDPTRAASFNKLLVALTFLATSEYVFILDGDAIVADPTQSLEHVIAQLSSAATPLGRPASLILSSEYNRQGEFSPINAGNFIVRRTSEAEYLLRETYNKFVNGHYWYEQTALVEFMAHHANFSAQHVAIVPYRHFNQHRNSYQKGDFVVHYAGAASFSDKARRIRNEMSLPELSQAMDLAMHGDVCLDSASLSIRFRSATWHLAGLVLPRWGPRYKLFYYSRIFSTVRIAADDASCSARSQRPCRRFTLSW